MDFNFFSHPDFQKLIQALCLTLLHSLWQGLISAVLAGAVLFFTNKQKPALRYHVLCAVLLVFISCVGLTFFLEVQNLSKVSNPGLTFINSNKSLILNKELTVVQARESVSWIKYLTEFCKQNAQIIVAIWFLVFGLKSVQAVAGVHYLRKIRTRNVYEPSTFWKTKFRELAEKMQIGQAISMLESGHVTVPMVIGFFKPVVLVPLGLLASLPAAQIEAILLHELAHIRRRDYLVNMMQIFCENVFFFNPAVLWISHLIKEEREHCCDDLAISVMQNKTSFIHALVSFQEYNVSASAFSMTFSKKRNHLLDRIKRIINNNNKPLDAMEKLFVTVSLVAVAALSAAVSHVAPEKFRPVAHVAKSVEMITPIMLPEFAVVAPVDTIKKKKKESDDIRIHSANVYSEKQGVGTFNVNVDGKQYDFIQQNGKTTALSIDGKTIPENEIASHSDEIEKIMQKVKVAQEQAELDRRNAEKSRDEAQAMRKQADEVRLQAEEQRILAERKRAEAEVGRQMANQNRVQAEKMREQANVMRVDAENQRGVAEKVRAEAEVSRKKAEEYRIIADQERKEYEKKQDGLIDDLFGAGIIKGISNLSYKLSDDELIVNGTKQPAALHEKMKSKYLTEKGSEMVYKYQGRTGYTRTGTTYSK
ncbi:M56 family metallopeptidase [Dyadobacter luticola]|uniref:Peptidase M56 BlaR1 n=1 Tax=Dyadobacter luticola TaxID=1979387 RepID=A0A5R9L2Q2_9BACT|nr:M56 family metallopeptidase [Dyadobacter luticola]TLV02688.1 peptidase M56 BlaR1 [Dyadobacter luticola]